PLRFGTSPEIRNYSAARSMWSSDLAGREPRRHAAGQQQVVPAAGVHDTGSGPCNGASAPKKIAAGPSPDRPARVLRHQHSAHAFGRSEPLICFEPDRDTESDEGAINRNAPFGRQDDAFGADRTVSADLAKKHIRRVLSTQHSTGLWVLFHPGTDCR